ncbi:MAG: TetR/AcrR family transcriptional regulator [Firmicutes bacterium]|nr:TetR/AcrR family transcriptional regulator [Bacillota bacterium]
MPNQTSDPRSNIIESAKSVVAQQGVYNTTLQTIADEAGISKGALYYYYKSKDSILYDMMDKDLSQSARLAKRARNQEVTPEEMKPLILKIIEERITKTDYNKLHIYLAQEALLGNEELHDSYLKKYQEWADSIEEVLMTVFGLKKSEMCRAMATLLLAAVDGLCIQELFGLHFVDREVLKKLGRLLLEGDPEAIRRELNGSGS